MASAVYFRLKGETADLPLMLWPDDEGDFIIQIGRQRPWTSYGDRSEFAAFVIDTMWLATPITEAEWHFAMINVKWPDGKNSKETA
jgi:hypothetical protein